MPHRAVILIGIAIVLACAGCGGGGGYQGKPPPPPTPGIDLGKLSFGWLPHPTVSSTPITTSLTIKNYGTDAAGSFRVRYDYELEGGTSATEYKFIDHLAPGTTVTLQTTYLPLVWGTLYVHITIDPDHDVDDALPGNNPWTESIQVFQPTHLPSGAG